MTTNDHVEASANVTVEEVIAVAITQFSTDGFDGTKLEDISRASGMSKRMIHYHFGDKRGLYLQSLNSAMDSLQPPSDQLVIDSAVPVEGMHEQSKLAAHVGRRKYPPCTRSCGTSRTY